MIGDALPLTLHPPLPRSLYVETTSRCNSKCATCILTFGGREPAEDLTWARFRHIVDQAVFLFAELAQIAQSSRVWAIDMGEVVIEHCLAIGRAGIDTRHHLHLPGGQALVENLKLVDKAILKS